MTQVADRANPTVAVIGLGYVDLPLAVAFDRLYRTFGLGLAAVRTA